MGHFGVQASAVDSAGGVFYNGRTDGKSKTTGASWDREYITKIKHFDASRSSSIYGRSIHVTPENYTVRIWKRIA